MDALFNWLSHYGYAGLFGLLVMGIVGLPIPDETLLTFSGYLISKGRFHPALAFAAGFSGSVCGISLSYLIGRTAGQKAVRRYGNYVRLTDERLDHVHRWFERIGDWLLTLGYFIPGVRHFTALVAGMSRVKYVRFAVFAYTGAAIWVATFLSIGYFVGENWRRVLEAIHRYTVAAVVIVLIAAIAIWFVRKQQTTQSP